MKKVIYGMIVLVGGLLIASNFIVDSSKIDHKKVSASGTACRWISESGYGYGPHYVVESGVTINSSGTTATVSTSNLNLFSCSAENAGTKKDGSLLYNDTGVEYTGYLGLDYYSSPTNVQYTKYAASLYYFESGKMVKALSQSDSSYSNSKSFIIANLVNSSMNLFNGYQIDFNAGGYYIGKQIKISYPNSSDEWIFTCVCAEY